MPRPRYHLLTSAALGTFLWIRRGRRDQLTAALLSGFLVDLDHLVDYAWGRQHGAHGTMVLPLHGWEWLPVLAAADRRVGLRGALLMPYLVHLVADQIWNEKRSPLAYSIVFRARRGFRADQLGPVDPTTRHAWRRGSLADLWRFF